MPTSSYPYKALSLFYLTSLFAIFFITIQATAEPGEFQRYVSTPMNNKTGILIGRAPNPFPPYNQSFQIGSQTVTSRSDGTAWCGRPGDPVCNEIFYTESQFTAPSSATSAIFTTSGAIGASITPQGQVCANLMLNIYDQFNSLVLRKTVGSLCRIGTASLRLGDRNTLTNSFGISLNAGAVYKIKPSIQCIYGKMAFNGGKHHCEAFHATTQIHFLGNQPIGGGVPDVVVEPPIETLPEPGNFIYY